MGIGKAWFCGGEVSKIEINITPPGAEDREYTKYSIGFVLLDAGDSF